MPKTPNTLSIYRGQAKSGIGEGPSIPVAHGEQYLEGTAEAFCDDDILRAIRPWLTLDSDSSDHQSLQDRLEGWSCFSAADWLFVVRLASAGIYDRRAAYFSHARAWPLGECHDGFDPGVYLGCSAVFDPNQAHQGGSDPELDKLPPEAVVRRWLPPLQAKAAAATAFLGHLLQAMEQGYPLLIAAPITAFTPGDDLLALVSFARAALPADLKSRCTIRVYTRQPERFALHLKADLILLPDDSAAAALAAQDQATLLDPQGRLLKTRHALEAAAQTYAQVAVAGTLNAPQGLLPFSSYLGKHRQRGLRIGENVPLLQLSYLLAMGLAGDEADRTEVFRYIMRTQGPGLPWEKLLDDDDWARFPQATLAEFVLSPADALRGQGELELQAVVASVMDRQGLSLDAALQGWWQDRGQGKLGRLAELLSQAAGLFANPAALAEKTVAIPLNEWRQATPALHGLLKLELDTDTLARRSAEPESLAELAKAPVNYAVLAAATKAGQLGPEWAEQFIRQARPEDAVTLHKMARDWLKSPADLARWQGLPLQLIDCLRRLRTPIPADLAARIAALGQALDLAKDLGPYLRLADLLAPADPDTGALGDNPLMQGLWQNLDRLDSREAQRLLVVSALDQNWQCLNPASLLVLVTDAPWALWKAVLAEALLHTDDLRDRLSAARLLDCLREAGPRLDKAHIQQVYIRLTAHWRREPDKTTAALIRSGAWLGWRRASDPGLSSKDTRQAALAWLACREWQEATAPEACLESWQQVIGDLQPALPGEDLQRIRQGKDHQGAASWPWIARFQEEQLADMARLAKDLGTLAEFAEAVRLSCRYAGNPVDPIREAFVAFKEARALDLPAGFSADALLWLMSPTPPQAHPLDLETSLHLLAHAGHRHPQAFLARIRAALAAFDTQPQQALAALDQPNLWQERAFIDPWAEWLGKQASADFLAYLDRYLSSTPKSLPFILSSERIAAAVRLRDRGYQTIADRLHPDQSFDSKPSLTHASPKSDVLPGLAGVVLQAILDMRGSDKLWGDIANGVFPEDGHPFIELVQYNDILGLFHKIRRDNTLQEAISKNPGLLHASSATTPRLPVFELYVSVHGEGNIATAITAFVRFVYNHHNSFQRDPHWWQALIESIEKRCHNRPDNHSEMAWTTLCRSANNNIETKSYPEKRRLSLDINQALCQAMIAKGYPDKARLLISE